MLYGEGSHNYVEAALRRLKQKGYILALPRGQRQETVYALDARGLAYLREAGFAMPSRLRKSEVSVSSPLHLQHANEITDVLIAAKLYERMAEGVVIEELIHDRNLAARAVRVTLPSGKRRKVQPDGFIQFRLECVRKRASIVLEVDRGTERYKDWSEKVEGLLAFALPDSSGVSPYEREFGRKSLTIAVVTPEQHCQSLVRWTEQVLEEQHLTSEAGLFRFCGLPAGTVFPKEWFTRPVWRVPFVSSFTTLWPTGEEDV